MSKLSEQLIRTLKREQEIYDEVAALAEKKKKIIIEGNLKELEEITLREKEIVGILIKLENLRSQTAEELAAENGATSPGTLRDLIPYLPSKDQEEVSGLQNLLKETIRNVQERNDLNGKLLQQSLEIVEFNLNLISSVGNISQGYTPDAEERDEKNRSTLFDAKV